MGGHMSEHTNKGVDIASAMDFPSLGNEVKSKPQKKKKQTNHQDQFEETPANWEQGMKQMQEGGKKS
jgi:hypothetical protein